MERKLRGNRVSPEEFRELVKQSGLTQNKFAKVMGVSSAALSELMTGHTIPSLVMLNAARFVMLRLGHPIEIKPIDDAMFNTLPRKGHATARR